MSNVIDQNLLEFARQVAAIPRRIMEEENARAAAPDAPVAAAVAERPASIEEVAAVSSAGKVEPALPVTKSSKKLRTAEEISLLIMATLRELGGVPERGFAITVYGSNPWNALLTIRPEAGPRIDRTLWVSRVQDITAHLRSEFDVAYERVLSPPSRLAVASSTST